MLAIVAMLPQAVWAANNDPQALRRYVGASVYVQDRDGREIKTRLLSVTDEGVGVVYGATEQVVSWQDVRRVYLVGDRVSDGVGKGVGIGIGLGILGTQGYSCGGNCPGAELAGIAFSAAIYGAIGAWLDKRHVGRTVIYESK